MKKSLAIFVALMAAITGGLALDATPPAWLENMQPGASYTYGESSAIRAAVTDEGFVPQSLNSKLIFTSGDVSANVDQTAATSIAGTPEGTTRQLLEQTASAYVAQWPTIDVDAEVDGEKTTQIMNIETDQSALFSGKIVSDISETLTRGVDAPFDGTGAADKPNGYGQVGLDDQYGGGHMLAWLDLTGNPASWTATFNDAGSLTATDANEKSVTLKQSLVDAKVTVSAEARDPNMVDRSNLISITKDSGCAGAGDLWTLNPDGTTVFVGKGDLVASDYSGSAQLTEAAASVSSDVTLTDKELMILGNVFDIRTVDGSFGLDGAFADAVLTEDSIIDVDLDGDMDFWWT